MARPPILTPDALRALEARHANDSPPLMERAGRALASRAAALAVTDGPIVVVAGPGNNGGDARIAAARLAASGRKVVVVDAASGWAWPGERPALVIDGLLGIGLSRDVDGAFARVIESINACPAPRLAVDVPSGLDAQGRVRGVAVRATHTLTFIAHKPGLLTLEAADHVGALALDDLGLGAETAREAQGQLLRWEDVRDTLPRRGRNAHKGLFGTLGIVGGAAGMVGAALLAARAGLLAGAGKVRVGLLDERLAVDPLHPELMIARWPDALEADVVVLGPGAGGSPSRDAPSPFEAQALPRALAGDKPLVLDADALNAIARDPALRAALERGRAAPTLLTPHPAEAARLLGCETREVQGDRLAAARSLARRLHSHVVLKGAGSICAFPEGRFSINTTGNAGLASGGTGDVLAGIAGALLAQRLEAPAALELAVCLHGAAADALVARGVGPVGLTASEVALEARRLLNSSG